MRVKRREICSDVTNTRHICMRFFVRGRESRHFLTENAAFSSIISMVFGRKMCSRIGKNTHVAQHLLPRSMNGFRGREVLLRAPEWGFDSRFLVFVLKWGVYIAVPSFLYIQRTQMLMGDLFVSMIYVRENTGRPHHLFGSGPRLGVADCNCKYEKKQG